jgi:hypothetical protein
MDVRLKIPLLLVSPPLLLATQSSARGAPAPEVENQLGFKMVNV